MKGFFSILLSLHLFLGGIIPGSLHELHKLPGLLKHYRQHTEQSSTPLSFVDFLALHYFSEHGKKVSHEELPGVHLNCAMTAFVLPSLTAFYTPVSSVASQKPCSHYLTLYSFQKTNVLIQPPRFS